MLVEMKHCSHFIQVKASMSNFICLLEPCFVKLQPFKMLVEMKHFSQVIQVKYFSPKSEFKHEHFSLSFGTMLCQVTTFQNVGWDETLFTCHTSERFFPRVNLTMNILICLLKPCFVKMQCENCAWRSCHLGGPTHTGEEEDASCVSPSFSSLKDDQFPRVGFSKSKLFSLTQNRKKSVQ